MKKNIEMFNIIESKIEPDAIYDDWEKLGEYIGTYSLQSGFFEEPVVKRAVNKILGKEADLYNEFKSLSGCGEISYKNGLMFGDVSQQHVGGYNSIFFVDIQNQKMYLFWLFETVSDKKYKIYGDKPIPKKVLNIIIEEMNTAWGHVADFKVKDDRINIKLNSGK